MEDFQVSAQLSYRNLLKKYPESQEMWTGECFFKDETDGLISVPFIKPARCVLRKVIFQKFHFISFTWSLAFIQ